MFHRTLDRKMKTSKIRYIFLILTVYGASIEENWHKHWDFFVSNCCDKLDPLYSSQLNFERLISLYLLVLQDSDDFDDEIRGLIFCLTFKSTITDSKSKSQLYSSQGLKNEDLQTEMLIDRFFEAAWEADDLLDYIGGNPFSVAKVLN